MLDERHEIIEFGSHIPLKIFIHKLGSVTKHWHSSLELLMVLEGNIIITVDGNTWKLKDEDVILINSNSIHEIYSETGAVMIAVQIKLSLFNQFQSDLTSIIFDCNSATNPDFKRYANIRFAIASLIQANSYHSDGTDYLNYSLSYYLVSQLLENFKSNASETLQKQQKYMERLTRIINYINEHYAENFSLSDLAAMENLSVPYLSQFFDKYMGVKFTQYYNSIKLEHAVSDLISTKDSIETIAMRNGFTESHAFIRTFKKQYQMLPSAFRKQQAQNPTAKTAGSDINYLLLEPSNYLQKLTRYLSTNDLSAHSMPSAVHKEISVSDIRVTESISHLHHTFKTFTSVGRAAELLDRNIQEMLIDLQKNVGFKYVKFHGILSDDMMVVSRVGQELRFTYTLVDQVLDFLLSIGLKPLIQLSFMPKELAADPDKTICYCPFITSPPADMKEWDSLIDDFTRHLISRYTLEEVKQWPFTVWNEPVTSKKMFGFGDDALFFRFYKHTYDTVKRLCPEIQFGSPSMLYIENLGNADWIYRFIGWCREQSCMPDFMNIHYYADIILPTSSDDFFLTKATASCFPKATDDFSLFIGGIKKIFKTLGVQDKPVYMTEWNFTMSHRNLISDTSFKTCYIMKNLLKNYDRLDSFCYWSLTDLIRENPLPPNQFHGGLGIYTSCGLRKGVFYVFYFANMLGDELIAARDGYFITRKGDCYQIITYHYIHYGDLFASGELFDITETNRYTAFDTTKDLDVFLQLTDIANGNYNVKEYFVNRHHGNAYDIWLEMGAIPLSPQDTDLLRGLCVPGFHQSRLFTEKHTLTYTAQLEPFEIRFAELRPV